MQAQRENAEQQQKLTYTIVISSCVLVLVLTAAAIGACFLLGQRHQMVQQNLQLTEQLNAGLLSKVAEQDEEITYLRDWRSVVRSK